MPDNAPPRQSGCRRVTIPPRDAQQHCHVLLISGIRLGGVRGPPKPPLLWFPEPHGNFADERYPSSVATDSELGSEWDYCGLWDPDASRKFQAAVDYFGYSDDSSVGGYDPSRECFVVAPSAPARTPKGAVGSADSFTTDGAAAAQDVPDDAARRVRLDELEEAQRQLEDERANLHQWLGQEPNPTLARAHVRDVHRRIVNDTRDIIDDTLVFKRVSQNLTAAAMIFTMNLDPATPQKKGIHPQLKTLLEIAVVQQAESSASRQRGSQTCSEQPPPLPRHNNPTSP